MKICDVCLKSEIEPVTGSVDLRKMWYDREAGLILCEQCKDNEDIEDAADHSA